MEKKQRKEERSRKKVQKSNSKNTLHLANVRIGETFVPKDSKINHKDK